MVLPDLPLPEHCGVEAFWESQAPGGPHRVLPDGCMDLLFELTTGQARVIGTMSQAHVVHLERGERFFGVRFRAGFAPHFIGVSAAELRDEDAPVTDVLRDGAQLTQRVLAATNPRERSEVCVQFLQQSRPRGLALDHRIANVVQQLGSGAVAIAAVAERVGLSERQLERLFALHVGVGPKVFARVTRLQHALHLSRQLEARSQAHLAAAAGFADEPHLVREFKALAGCTLSQLRRERDVGIVQDEAEDQA